ncbi:MAG: DUF2911 domain-containing protein [Bacteroidia bacterium]
MKSAFLNFSAGVLILFMLHLPLWAQTSDKQVTSIKKDDRPSPPAEAKGAIGDLSVKINYCQPGVKGRKIWGELVPYGKVWRTGANEATTIELSRDCKVEGKMLKAGKYALFTIPSEKEWTIIFNSVPDQWGAYKYDEAKDALRISVQPKASTQFSERLTFQVSGDNSGEGGISLMWENVKINWSMR